MHCTYRQCSNCTCDARSAIIIVFYHADWTIGWIQIFVISSFFAAKSCTFLKSIQSTQVALMSWHHDIVRLLHFSNDVIALNSNERFEHCPAIWLSNMMIFDTCVPSWITIRHRSQRLFRSNIYFQFSITVFMMISIVLHIKSMSLFCPLLVECFSNFFNGLFWALFKWHTECSRSQNIQMVHKNHNISKRKWCIFFRFSI